MIAQRVAQHLPCTRYCLALGRQGAHVGALGFTHALRPVAFDAAGGRGHVPLDNGTAVAADRLGFARAAVTPFSRNPDLWAAILAVLTPEVVNVILTGRSAARPAALGPVPVWCLEHAPAPAGRRDLGAFAGARTAAEAMPNATFVSLPGLDPFHGDLPRK